MVLRGALDLGMPCAASMPTSKPGRPRSRMWCYSAILSSPPVQDQLADHLSGLELLVRLAQIGGVDRRQFLAQRAAQLAGVEPFAHLVEELVLLDHVGRLEARAGEHELPADARALR